MTKGRWLLALIVLVLVGFATARGLQPKPPPPAEITTSLVKRQDLTHAVTAAGHLQARETVKVSSNVTGDLLELAVREGDHVKPGQVLGQIDRRLGASQVAQYKGAVASASAQTAEIDAAIAQDHRNVDRARRLVAEGIGSQADLEKAETQLRLDEAKRTTQQQIVAQSRGQLDTALYNLSRTTLMAPIEGTILELYHKVGERIRGSDFSEDVVLLLGGLADMEVKAEVGEHEVVNIQVGNDATVTIDAIADKQFHGKVVAVGRNAQIKNPGTDAEVTTFFVRVGLDAPPAGGLPGMSATVSIATSTKQSVLTVPIPAVTTRDPQKLGDAGAPPAEPGAKPKPLRVVFVMKGGKAELRRVKTGITSRADVEIEEGLAEGETVIDGPYRTLARELADGQGVKLREDDPKGDKVADKR
jgi:HlyD family secretion protein